MNAPLIWLHEEALRISHPVFKAAPAGTRAIFAWDDAYFKSTGYTLKRLIFIYETLCELPIDIIYGNTLHVIRELAPPALFIPATNNPLIMEIVTSLKAVVPIDLIEDEAFAVIKKGAEFRRFFQYWNKAEKTVFLHSGGSDA